VTAPGPIQRAHCRLQRFGSTAGPERSARIRPPSYDLPDDQLFQYDSDALQGERHRSVAKNWGTLIQRNPKATFSVEGYTDAFGSFEYNLDLSQRRADSVKRYLVEVGNAD